MCCDFKKLSSYSPSASRGSLPRRKGNDNTYVTHGDISTVLTVMQFQGSRATSAYRERQSVLLFLSSTSFSKKNNVLLCI